MNARTLRKRGFTLIETVLVLAIGLGLIVGGIVFFGQAQDASDLNERTRNVVGISTEVRAQYRTAGSFPSGNITNAVKDSSSIPESQFRGVTLTGSGLQSFLLEMTGLKEKVCRRMAASDMGPGGVTNASRCSSGVLAVTYTR